MSSKTAEPKVFTKTIGGKKGEISGKKGAGKTSKPTKSKLRNFSKKHQVHLFKGLASMLKSQINTADALKYYAHGLDDKVMAGALNGIRDDIASGISVHEAFKRSGRFDDMTIGLVRAGTDSGSLDKAFASLSHRISRELYFQKAIKKALIVPGIIIGILTGAFIVSQIKLVPQVKDMMGSFGANPDLATKISFKISDIVKVSWPFFVVSVLVLLGLILFVPVVKNTLGTLLMAKWRLLRLLVMSYRQMTFISVMHLLNSNGINLGKSIRVSAEAVKKTPFEGELMEVADKYESTGVPVSTAFSKYSSVDPQVVHMISIGERSASMDSQLKFLVDLYEEDAETHMERFTAILNFVVLIIAVGIIAMVYVGTFLPIFLMGPSLMQRAG